MEGSGDGVDVISEKYANMKIENRKLNDKIKGLEDDKKALEDVVSARTKENEMLKNEKAKSDKIISSLSADLNTLKSENSKIREQLTTALKTVETMKAEKDAKNLEITRKNEDLAKAQKQIEQLTNKILGLEKDLKLLEEKYNRVKQKNDDAFDELNSIYEKSKDERTCQDQVQFMRQEIEKCKRML